VLVRLRKEKGLVKLVYKIGEERQRATSVMRSFFVGLGLTRTERRGTPRARTPKKREIENALSLCCESVVPERNRPHTHTTQNKDRHTEQTTKTHTRHTHTTTSDISMCAN